MNICKLIMALGVVLPSLITEPRASYSSTYEPFGFERISKAPNGDELDSDVYGTFFRTTPDGRYVVMMTNSVNELAGGGKSGSFVIYDTVEKKYSAPDAGLDIQDMGLLSIYYDAYDNNRLKVTFYILVPDGTIIDPNNPTISRGTFIYDVTADEYELSTYKGGDYQNLFTSDGGRYSIINTSDSYIATDTDGTPDIYRIDREDNSVQIMPDTPWGGFSGLDTMFGGASQDMSKLMFASPNKFLEKDNNNTGDLYWYDFDSNRFVGVFLDVNNNFLPNGPFEGSTPDKIGEYAPTLSPDGMHIVSMTAGVHSEEDENGFYDDYLISISSNEIPTYTYLTRTDNDSSLNTSFSFYSPGVFSPDSNKLLTVTHSGEVSGGGGLPQLNESNLYVYDIKSGDYSKIMESNQTPGQITNYVNGAFLENNKILFTVADPNVLGLNEDNDNLCIEVNRPFLMGAPNTNCYDMYIADLKEIKGADEESPSSSPPATNPKTPVRDLKQEELPLTGADLSLFNILILSVVGVCVIKASRKKDFL